MKRFLLAVFFLLALPTLGWAQPNANTVPPACAAGTLANNTCVARVTGALVRVTDAASASTCTAGGTNTTLCRYNGSVWGALAPVDAEYTAAADKIVLCGQDANSGTIYGGPAAAAYLGDGNEFAIGGAVCNALDNATEATADAPIAADFPAFKVTGMYCRTSSDATNDQTFTLRSAAADLTPSVTCTVAGTGTATSCSTVTQTTTDIAAGATIAVKSVNTEDLSAQDFWCEVYFVIRSS